MSEHWDGVERRRMDHCESHLEMVKSVAVIETTIVGLDKRINGSLVAIENHMNEGKQWRVAIVGVAAALFVQFVGVVSLFSKLMKQVEINTSRLTTVEAIMPDYYSRSAAGEVNSKRIDIVQEGLIKLVERVNEIEKKNAPRR